MQVFRSYLARGQHHCGFTTCTTMFWSQWRIDATAAQQLGISWFQRRFPVNLSSRTMSAELQLKSLPMLITIQRLTFAECRSHLFIIQTHIVYVLPFSETHNQFVRGQTNTLEEFSWIVCLSVVYWLGFVFTKWTKIQSSWLLLEFPSHLGWLFQVTKEMEIALAWYMILTHRNTVYWDGRKVFIMQWEAS